MVRKAGIIKSNDDDSDRGTPKKARFCGSAEEYEAQKKGKGQGKEVSHQHHEDDSLTDTQRLRKERVEVRKDFTKAAQAKGADGQGIAESTNWLYWIFFGDKPKGDRDEWSHEDQQGTMTAEHFATNKIKDLPTPKEGSSQRRANDNVVEATKDGAKAAKEYVSDPDTPAGTLWGWLNPKTIWEEGQEEHKK